MSAVRASARVREFSAKRIPLRGSVKPISGVKRLKTNVTEFTSLREVEPQVPIETIRKLVSYFPEPQAEHALDPTYEYTEKGNNPDNVEIFKDLQKMEGAGLVVPVDEEHMYFAAMNSKSCKITKLGAHYWRLSKELKI